MKIKIKRFDKTIPLPEYKTTGSVCMDMYSRENVRVAANSFGYIPLNVAIEVPKNYWVMLTARSSLHKMGLMPANGIGVGDLDFSGDGDEYKLIVYNTSKNDVTIEKATRVAQIMVVRYEKTTLSEVQKLKNKNRGGIGSTGTK